MAQVDSTPPMDRGTPIPEVSVPSYVNGSLISQQSDLVDDKPVNRSLDLNSSPPSLSKYGRLRLPEGKSVHDGYAKVLGDAYSKTNPEGFVNLGVAENTIIWDELRDVFEKNFSLRQVDFTYGDSLYGSIRLRTALANLFNKYFHAYTPVSPDSLMTGAGLLPTMGQLGRALVDPGNGILLAAPYYHGFDFAFTSLSSIHLVGVYVPYSVMFDSPLNTDGTVSTVEVDVYFENALRESRRNGVEIQAVLLCNPQNPYGRCYNPEVLKAYCRFCERHNLHLISDEIYALSTFDNKNNPYVDPRGESNVTHAVAAPTAPFISILSLDLASLNVNPSRVHMIYGMSKDFNSNGFRAGVLHTSNKSLLQSLLATAVFMLVAAPSAGLWFSLLDNEEQLTWFVKRNREVLRDSYLWLEGWLKFHAKDGVRYLAADAGQFVMVNFRGVLNDEARYGSLFSPISGESNVKVNGAASFLPHLGSHGDDGTSIKSLNTMPPSGFTSLPESLLFTRETELASLLITNKVVVGRGTGFHMYEGGWYRFTFSVKRDAMNTALRRIERVLGWETWPPLSKSPRVETLN